MKNLMHPLFLFFSVITIATSLSCEKTPACELANTYTVTIENSHRNGNLQVNIDRDFRSVNGPGEYSIAPGEIEKIELPSGIHVIKARLVISSCSGSRCSITTYGQEDKEVDQPACGGATLIY